MSDLIQPLWYANLAAQGVLVSRLAFLRLTRRYSWFVLYWSLSTFQGLMLLIAGLPGSSAYWTVWAWTDLLVVVFQVLAVYEVYTLITASFAGLGLFGRSMLIVATLIGFALCAIIALADARAHLLFLIHRCVQSILAVFMICTAIVFFRFREPIKPNVIVHYRILTLYCAVNASVYFAINIGINRQISREIVLGAVLVCLLLWIVLITKQGEELPPAPQMSGQERDRIRGWNDEVLAAGRRLVRYLT